MELDRVDGNRDPGGLVGWGQFTRVGRYAAALRLLRSSEANAAFWRFRRLEEPSDIVVNLLDVSAILVLSAFDIFQLPRQVF
jgi:hypothetical protein